MVAWCHGAPGIGLARLASLPYADDAAIRQEIAAALQTTKTQGITAEQSLCHGTAGNLEMLLVASQTLETPPIQEIMRQHSPALLECVPAVVEQKVPSLPIKPLGLMTGLAGIGYTLLRVAAPERVPSILALDPPLSPTPLFPYLQSAIGSSKTRQDYS